MSHVFVSDNPHKLVQKYQIDYMKLRMGNSLIS